MSHDACFSFPNARIEQHIALSFELKPNQLRFRFSIWSVLSAYQLSSVNLSALYHYSQVVSLHAHNLGLALLTVQQIWACLIQDQLLLHFVDANLPATGLRNFPKVEIGVIFAVFAFHGRKASTNFKNRSRSSRRQPHQVPCNANLLLAGVETDQIICIPRLTTYDGDG